MEAEQFKALMQKYGDIRKIGPQALASWRKKNGKNTAEKKGEKKERTRSKKEEFCCECHLAFSYKKPKAMIRLRYKQEPEWVCSECVRQLEQHVRPISYYRASGYNKTW